MRTVGRIRPGSSPRGDSQVECAICGVVWYRSQMRDPGDGKLYCPDDSDGLTTQQLDDFYASQDEQRGSAVGHGIYSDDYPARQPYEDEGPPPTPLLLDTLDEQPLWASWLGGRLRASYGGAILRARNDAGDVLDIGTLSSGLADTAAILAHCGSGNGTLVRVYNHVADTAYEYLEAPSQSAEPLIVEAGSLITGANGYLAARFNGGFGPSSAHNALERADSLGLTGAPALTLAGDMALTDSPGGSSFDNGVAWIGSTADTSRTAFWVDLGYDSGGPTYIVNGSSPNGAVFGTADAIRSPGWWQSDIAASALIRASRAFVNGAAISFDSGQGTNLALNLSARRFGWGPSASPGNGLTGAGISPQGLLSSLFCWNAVLGAGDQALFDVWQAAHHA